MREARKSRETKETSVTVSLNLDGNRNVHINTGIGFFDHMLTLFGFHAGIDLEIEASGDLEVDDHHTVEDVGIVLGQTLAEAFRADRGIIRYGNSLLPMDEVLARVVLDVGGRAYLGYGVDLKREQVGTLAAENVEEFFRALVREAQIVLHIDILKPGNTHHEIEAIFKGFGRALRQAVRREEDLDVSSTKGVL